MNKPKRSMRLYVLLGIMVLAAVLCAWQLVGWLLVPTPPAVESAGASEMAHFIAGEGFAQLSSGDRERLVRELADRYWKMSLAERRAWDKELAGLPPSVQQAIRRPLGLSLVRTLLADYQNLDEQQRLARLRQLRAFADVLNIHGGVTETLRTEKNAAREAMVDERRFREGLANFQRDFLNTFSAAERANMAQMGRDLQKLKSVEAR